jgi:hypothetical protein
MTRGYIRFEREMVLPPVHCLEGVQLSRLRCIGRHWDGCHSVVVITDVGLDCGAEKFWGAEVQKCGQEAKNDTIYNFNFSFGAVAFDYNLLVNLLSGHCSPEP